MRCMDCGSETRRTSEPITEEYKGYSLTVPGVEHYVCDTCGEYEIASREANKLSRMLLAEYAKARGLLSPREIRKIRLGLRMKQSEFETLLGVSTPTVSRWETGAAAPSRSVCKLMRLYRDHPELTHDATRGGYQNESYRSVEVDTGVQWKVYDGEKAHTMRCPKHYSITIGKKSSLTNMLEAKEG